MSKNHMYKLLSVWRICVFILSISTHCVCSSSGHSLCVERAQALYGRCDLARKENTAVRGRGILGAAGSGSRSVHRWDACFPHLLLLEEEQKVLFSVFFLFTARPFPFLFMICLFYFPTQSHVAEYLFFYSHPSLFFFSSLS